MNVQGMMKRGVSRLSIDPGMVLDVMLFELKRSLTRGRLTIWCVLIAFPVGLFVLVDRTAVDRSGVQLLDPLYAGMLLYGLIPELVCLLGLLLWATPAISTEIEGQTWIYLAMRRSGRTTVLIGKYLTAVVWTLSAAVVAVSLCMYFVEFVGDSQLWWSLVGLSTLSCFAHAAIFILIGVAFPKRAMVTAVFYTLAIEYGISLIPALANKLTINYRLRGLLAEWMGWEEARSQAEIVFGNEAAWVHLLAIAAVTATTLCAAVFLLQRAEYPTQQDG